MSVSKLQVRLVRVVRFTMLESLGVCLIYGFMSTRKLRLSSQAQIETPLSLIVLRGVAPCAHRAIFKRLSLGGYGGLTCIKSIWIDSSSPGDKILRLTMSNGHVYSRVAPVNQCQFPIPRAKNGHFQSL